MSREKDGYRENLELLNARYPGADMLTINQVAAFTGMTRQTVRQKFPFNDLTRRISKADLARLISV